MRRRQFMKRELIALFAPGDGQGFFLFSFEKRGGRRRLHEFSAKTGKIRHGQISIAGYLKYATDEISARFLNNSSSLTRGSV
jgi:hypothetical protein